jgi:hypothetical protein
MADLDRARPAGHATGEAGAFTSSRHSSLHHGFPSDVPARYLLSRVSVGGSASLKLRTPHGRRAILMTGRQRCYGVFPCSSWVRRGKHPVLPIAQECAAVPLSFSCSSKAHRRHPKRLAAEVGFGVVENRNLGSGGECNTLGKFFGRRSEPERLAWTLVELTRHGIELGLSVMRYVTALGEVLA